MRLLFSVGELPKAQKWSEKKNLSYAGWKREKTKKQLEGLLPVERLPSVLGWEGLWSIDGTGESQEGQEIPEMQK